MSFLSGLKVFGKDVAKVITWIGSPTGQKIVMAGESVVETMEPVSIPIIALVNGWFQKIYAVESLAASAGQATGTGPDKAALAVQAIDPLIMQYIAEEGVSPRTQAQIKAANDGLLQFINAMTQPA
jgi:hypothetical protein